jgi:hypothetical protein
MYLVLLQKDIENQMSGTVVLGSETQWSFLVREVINFPSFVFKLKPLG